MLILLGLLSLSKIAQRVKQWRDHFYSLRVNGKLSLGKEDVWTIIDNRLQNPVVYSGGVGKNISFELELITLFQAQVFLYDPSETGINTMKNILPIEGLKFSPVALSDLDGILKLYVPVNPEEGSYTKYVHRKGNIKTIEFPCRKISSLMNENGHSKIDILKLDIEGSEYGVLENILDDRIEIDQLCIEFHHFFDDIHKSETRNAMARLKRAGYVMTHRQELNYLFCKRKLIS